MIEKIAKDNYKMLYKIIITLLVIVALETGIWIGIKISAKSSKKQNIPDRILVPRNYQEKNQNYRTINVNDIFFENDYSKWEEYICL